MSSKILAYLLLFVLATLSQLADGFQVNSSNDINRLMRSHLFATDKNRKSDENPAPKQPVTKASVGFNQVGADSNTRRQLLFSLLASAVGTSVSSSQALADLDVPIEVIALKEKESIANAFKNAVGGNLIIPPMDSRKYDTFTMPNGLKVILCSDTSLNTAAVAIDVHVGAASDPDTIPGMAHFNEHM